jgi:hypothetical protein
MSPMGQESRTASSVALTPPTTLALTLLKRKGTTRHGSQARLGELAYMPPTLPQVGVLSPAEANQSPHARLAAIADAIRKLTEEQSRILAELECEDDEEVSL